MLQNKLKKYEEKRYNILKIKKIEDLNKLVSEKRAEVTKIWAEIKAGKEKNLKKVSLIKRDIAKLMTIIREFELIKK